MSGKVAKQKRKQRESFTDKCKDSFALFLRACWKHLSLPDPTPRQIEIANYLQFGSKRDMVQAFRGVGKSWITSAYSCWELLRDPQKKILVVSASKDRSDAFSTFTLRLIKEMPMLKHLKPRHDQRESNIAFDVAPSRNAHAPSVKSAGIFGQITGTRADIIIADDIEIPNNSATDQMREQLVERVGEFNDILVPEGNPRIIFLGTPQTEESVYNKLRSRGYKCRIWCARYPNEKQIEGYRGALSPQIYSELEKNPDLVGEPTDPQRFHEMDLTEREASKGRSSFALQFMLDTTLSDANKYPLKTGDLICMDLNPDKAPSFIQYASGTDQILHELKNVGFAGDRWFKPMVYDTESWKKYEGIVMAIDPAGRGKDETGYAVVAQLHGKLFILAMGGLKGGYDDDTLKKLAHIAKANKVREIIIEANFGDGMYTKLFSPVLHRIWPCSIEEVKHSIQKEKRIIDTLEPVLNQHKLVMNIAEIKKDIAFLMLNPERNMRYSFAYQLTRITRERGALKHDDRLDALCIAVDFYTESMDRDSKKADAEHKLQLLQAEVKKHREHVLGKSVQDNSGFLGKRFRR